MDLTQLWVVVVFIVCYEQSSIASNVNVLDKNDPGRSRPKKSADTEIFLALPPDNVKTGKQDGPPTLIRLDPKAPNKFKGKFPTPIERFIQRIQNYFSVYNPQEYLNDVRPGINNPDNDGDQEDYSNDTQIILPCNGTSTIVIIPVPLENENASNNQYTNPEKPANYIDPTTQRPNYSETVTLKPACPEEVTTTNPKCPEEVTTTKPQCPEEVTTTKPKCPEEITTTKPKCPEEITTTTPKCPEATTPKPDPCPEETTTPKPKCPEVTTPIPKCPEVTTPKPKCPEVTTPKPKCPEVTTPKPKCPEVTTPKSECPPTTPKTIYPPKPITFQNDPKPISGYGPSEVPPLNLVAQPIVGSSVVFFYKNPSTSTSNPLISGYYVQNTPPPYEEHTRRPKPPLLRLKQLLFPRLYAAFHPDD